MHIPAQASLLNLRCNFFHILCEIAPRRFPAFQRLQQQLGREANGSEEDDGSDMSPPPPPLPPPGAGDDVVFMRWKEKSFETGYGEGCGLTIAVSNTNLGILSPSQSGNPH